MAASATTMGSESNSEVFPWLKSLPLAPEYHPTLAEFQDPISYIFKIEKEASKYGICKIVPPVLPAPKKSVITNLNKSLTARTAAAQSSSASNFSPTFTTRQQQIGFCPRKPRPVQKPVWQSGEYYTFQEFEAKAKNFERNYLKKCAKKGVPSALEIETLFWKASVDSPFSVEYANDMPGSAFAPRKVSCRRETGEGLSLGETAWNMREVSRAKGSLLRFMREEIPGVTSPMVYIAMMFSWFAWHVEDHDLHSLNYLHLGAGKTWYGVPREAAVAVEEVVRVHGYGGEINPLVTFAILGEKTTVMSPEVFISAGIPCCRLVQNAGEFVVTFPRAYHSGFSHGFNCGEASNIATPEWLRVAKDAAIRRASINYPPMVSHFQLLYDLALALCSRVPMSISAKPRSSRLKDKKKGEGETLVKELFVENVIQNNNLLHILGKGSLIVLLPQSSSDISGCSNVRVGSQLRVKPRFSLGLCNPNEEMKASGSLVSDDIMLNRNQGIKPMKGFYPVKGKFASLLESNKFLSSTGNDGIFSQTSRTLYTDTERGSDVQSVGLSDQRLFSCTTCGILTFSCVAIIQPREPAARYLMSADCSFFNDWIAGSGVTRDGFTLAGRDAINSEQNSCPGWMEKSLPNGLYDVPVQSADYQIQMADQNNEVNSNSVTPKDSSALGLLASTYGNSSDSEEDQVEPDAPIYADDIILRNCSSESRYQFDNSGPPSLIHCESSATEDPDISLSRLDCRDEVPSQNIHCYADNVYGRANFKDRSHQPFECPVDVETDNFPSRSSVLDGRFRNPVTVSHITSNCSPVTQDTKKKNFNKAIVPVENTTMPFAPRSDEDSSRMHIFCLEHAVEVEQQLRSIGGVHMLLLCHPDYPKVEAEAKLVAEELGINYMWNDITFRDATKDDESRIQSALDSEESIPGNGDWAVKLGINLFYSANLSHSPLYSKQMPYNSVIYNAFGRSSPASSPIKFNVYRRRTGKQKKVVAGKWCGRVWMSNQVHPFLVQRDPEEQEQDKSFHAWEIPDEKIERKSERTPKTETTLMTRNSGRKRKMTIESGSTKKVKYMDAEDVVSDGSLEDDYRQQYGRILRSNPPKHTERENVIADDSLKENSHQQRRRFIRGKQAKCIEREDAGSDESLDDNSHLQHRRFLRGKQAKCFEREDEVTYDSLDDYSDQHHVGILRGRQFKCFEREDAISYDSLEDDSDQHHGGILRGEQSKYTNGEYVVSDDLAEDDSYPQHRRILRGRQPKYVEGEDAVADDLLEDNSLQQHRWNLRGKKTKCVEREAVSDDILEDNCLQMHKRALRGKQVKSMERDDAVSDNSVENNSHRQHRRILRSKQMKQETSPPIKQGTSRPMKRGSSGLVKQGTSRLFKQATTVLVKQRAPRQLKQETTRKMKQEILELRNSKRDRSGRQFNTNVEEELEGGPSTRLRKRTPKPKKELETKLKEKKQTGGKKLKNASAVKALAGYNSTKRMDNEDEHQCDIEGCTMSFGSKQELTLHKRNICPVKGCGKKFFSHKYLVQHRRVHLDDRPLKCPWKGCKMTFKWAWARTEHIRVHTGARPYVCTEAGCGQTFRFVSDFSRHKRKTGHSAKKVRR